jgi:ATP-dependent Lhr-like helicase
MDAIAPADVAEFVSNVKFGKFREQVPDELARALWARENKATVASIAGVAKSVLAD